MRTSRNARIIGLVAMISIASLPTAAASHYPLHAEQCDPYPAVNEVACTILWNPISAAVWVLLTRVVVGGGYFVESMQKIACDFVDEMIRSPTQWGTPIACPW